MPSLKRRYLLAITAVMAAMLLLLATLWYLRDQELIAEWTLRWSFLATGIIATALVLVLCRRFAEGILRPLRDLVAELKAALPDSRTADAQHAIPELHELAETLEVLRTRLRTSTQLARVDPLTRLANRLQFQHQLQQAIARARRAGEYLALIYLDADRFKDINDTFGHAAGDTTLEKFSRRIAAELPEGAGAGRLAGDEFAVLLPARDDIDQLVGEATAFANRLLRAVGRPFAIHGEEIFMTTSVGIALYPRDGSNVIDLFRNADAALYQAKRLGGNCFELYTVEMNAVAVERLMLKSRLRRAFERDELRLHYQPKYNLRSGRMEGAEALIRWDVPGRGLVFPSDFIPLAEESNLILQVGDWVLNQVCADYRRWQRSLPSPCRVSVNLSLRQLNQRRFLDNVRDTFQAHGVSPTCVELEITETTLMEDTHRTVRILDALYGMGLHLTIDDFGTGYSSLSALQQFPINTLKIDQSFIHDLGTAGERDGAAIVTAVIRMAHSLKLDVVAEGVESPAQLQFLREHGCDYGQGHLFGDPMTADAFCALLQREQAGAGKPHAWFA